jgi:hypothetical protein
MSTARYFVIITLLCLGYLRCSNTVYHYSPNQGSPRVVYIDDQVQQVWPKLSKMPYKTFVEVTTRDGDKEKGLLKSVSDQTMTLDLGYILSANAGATGKKILVKEIPKQQIMLLKVW